MHQKRSLHRAPIYTYVKSRRHVAIYRDSGHDRYIAIDLNDTMSGINKIRSLKTLQEAAMESTGLTLESILAQRTVGDEVVTQHTLIRVLSRQDLSSERWDPSLSIEELAISPTEFITPEERQWAGEKAGTIGGGILLAVVTAGAWGISYSSEWNWFPVGIASLLSILAVRYDWRKRVEASPERLDALKARKSAILGAAEDRHDQRVSDFSRRLDDFEYWRRLSPEAFESAVALKLRERGFQVAVTQYSGDGGIDVEGRDENDTPVIVQAKQYQSRVGVAVVREMIGIRQARSDQPRTIIAALTGFTRGATELAESNDVELLDVRSDILGIR